MPQFVEVFRCAGVDHDANLPGMVIPKGGVNYVAIQKDRQAVVLKANSHPISLALAKNRADIERARASKIAEVNKPGVDKGYFDAYVPVNISSDMDIYTVTGKQLAGEKENARINLNVGGKFAKSMPVLVVDTITVKIAICNLQIIDNQGNSKPHATKAANANAEVAAMNLIWLPQTQIKFELISSQDAVIDLRKQDTRATIKKGLKLLDTDEPAIAQDVSAAQLIDVFVPLKFPGAAITFFVVQSILDGNERPSGQAFAKQGIAFIIGNRSVSTAAHEAGHILGRSMSKGTVVEPYPHQSPINKYNEKSKEMDLQPEDYRQLMRDGGGGVQDTVQACDHIQEVQAVAGLAGPKSHVRRAEADRRHCDRLV